MTKTIATSLWILAACCLTVDQARGDVSCRECRDRYNAVLDQCARARLSARECRTRALNALGRCLESCGFIQSNITELPTRNPVADPELVVSIEELSASDGKVRFSLALDTSTTGPFRRLVVGVASLAPGVCEIEDISLGSGLLSYVAQNDEPPTCDIVIFPPAPGQPAGSITKLFLDEPYDSEVYGSEYLIVTMNVTADEPRPTVIQLFEEDDVIRRGDQLHIQQSDCDAVRLRVVPAASFIRGDANVDGSVDLSDSIASLRHLFGSRFLSCEDAADFNDDGSVDIADPILLLNSLFSGSAAASFLCAPDATPDDLSCRLSWCN